MLGRTTEYERIITVHSSYNLIVPSTEKAVIKKTRQNNSWGPYQEKWKTSKKAFSTGCLWSFYTLDVEWVYSLWEDTHPRHCKKVILYKPAVNRQRSFVGFFFTILKIFIRMNVQRLSWALRSWHPWGSVGFSASFHLFICMLIWISVFSSYYCNNVYLTLV